MQSSAACLIIAEVGRRRGAGSMRSLTLRGLTMRLLWSGLILALATMVAAGAVHAQPVIGVPEPWQLGFQPPASPSMERLDSLHDLLMWIITLISLFVLVLLALACVRFRAERHPTPSRRTHHTALEIAWTLLPVLILVVIAIPSFRLLYFMDRADDPEMTIKAIGKQWFWTYEYPDHGDFTFDSFMLRDDELQPGQPRLLATDTHVVVPVNTNIRLLTTATDVIHSWAIPRFGVKKDAVPGRVNETWFRVEEPGLYYGQCSELCGVGHAFMPITVEAVSQEEFQAWVEQAQAAFPRADGYDVATRDGGDARPAN
jgi:cytochrome c oxidase subunit II